MFLLLHTLQLYWYEPHLHFEHRSQWLDDASFGTFVSGFESVSSSSSSSEDEDIDDKSDGSALDGSVSLKLKPTSNDTGKRCQQQQQIKIDAHTEPRSNCAYFVVQWYYWISIYLDTNHWKWFDGVFDVHLCRLMMNVYYCGDSWLHDYNRTYSNRRKIDTLTHTHALLHTHACNSTENALDNSIVVLNFWSILANLIVVNFFTKWNFKQRIILNPIELVSMNERRWRQKTKKKIKRTKTK